MNAERRQGKRLLSPKGFAELVVCAAAVGRFRINSPLSCLRLTFIPVRIYCVYCNYSVKIVYKKKKSLKMDDYNLELQ